jgi:hypothetical protein
MTNEHPVPDSILQLGFVFWGSKALLSAVEPDCSPPLPMRPVTAEAVAADLGLQRRGETD